MSQAAPPRSVLEDTLVSRFTIVILSTLLLGMDRAGWAPAWLADHASSISLFGLSCFIALELVARGREVLQSPKSAR
jgi:hypothetical protein